MSESEGYEGSAVVGKIYRRLIPFLCLLFIVNYLDRTNVAMAALKMEADAGLTDATYGLGAGLFFVGYFLFEVPSNLILHRVGARRWIARIMISWGILSAAMMLTRGPRSFFALRLMLGLAEAGFFPGIVYYLTAWVPASRRSGVLAAFLTSTALSGVVGTPLAGTLMKLEGVAGLHGWQWLFLLEGIPAVVLGIAILMTGLLPDAPANAAWVTGAERDWIERELSRDHSHPEVDHIGDLRAAVADGRLWLLSLIYFMLIMGLYGFIYWVPKIVKSLSGASDFQVGWIAAIPYAVGAISMVVIGIATDRAGRRRLCVAGCAITAALGVALLAFNTGPIAGLLSMCLAAIGIFGTLGPFWTLPTRYLRGRAAAAGIAVINSSGALSGFVAPWIIGLAKQRTGLFTGGLLVVAASLALGALLVLLVPASADN